MAATLREILLVVKSDQEARIRKPRPPTAAKTEAALNIQRNSIFPDDAPYPKKKKSKK